MLPPITVMYSKASTVCENKRQSGTFHESLRLLLSDWLQKYLIGKNSVDVHDYSKVCQVVAPALRHSIIYIQRVKV